MFDATASPAPSAGAERAADLGGDRDLAMLQRLAEIGMDFAEAIHREVFGERPAGETPPPMVGDRALVFFRLSRAVRQTLALKARLAADLQARERGDRDAAREGEARRARTRRKAEVREIVRQVIEAETMDCVHRSWFAQLDERLDREDDEDETALADLPLGECVAHICRDLGLAPDWSRWKAEWARVAATADRQRRALMRGPPRAQAALARAPSRPPPPDLSG